MNLKVVIGVCVVVLLVLAIPVILTFLTLPEITLEQFRAITYDMSYKEVVEILGREGTLYESKPVMTETVAVKNFAGLPGGTKEVSRFPGYNYTTYAWYKTRVPRTPLFTVTFRTDKMTKKENRGLGK